MPVLQVKSLLCLFTASYVGCSLVSPILKFPHGLRRWLHGVDAMLRLDKSV